MSENHGSDPLSVEEPSQSPPANDPVTSEGELPAGAERRETKDTSGMENAGQTRPDIPPAVSLRDVYWTKNKVYTEERKTKAWSDAAEMVQTYSDEMIKRWKEEIDTYLVFAGLFSAVLTTFNVQSYLLLQPPAPDPSIAVLQQISSQLASFSIHPPFVNSTQPSSATRANANTAPPVPRWAVWLNALWFSGLILSLSSASVGIMVKQWLNEYSSGASGTSRPVARVRQYRLNNLRTWRVEDIIGAIPILLQLALALFLSGMLILLWTLHDTVAAIASTLVGLLAVFTVVTTLLPLFNHKCSYLTPQIRAVNAAWQPKRISYCACSSISAWCHAISGFLATTRLASYHTLSSFDPRLHRYLTRLLLWSIQAMFCYLEHAVKTPERWRERKQTWQGRERSTINNLASGLDIQTLVEAYNTTLSPDALSAASVCLMDFSASDVVDYFQQLHESAREHFGPAVDSESGPLGRGNQQQLLWLQIILCVLFENDIRLSDDKAAALGVYFEYGLWSSGLHVADAGWAVSTCNAISDLLETEGPSSALKFIDQGQIEEERSYLIGRAMRREKPLTSVLLPGVTGAYRQVRLKQSHLPEARSNDTKDAHKRYLQSVDNFLVCANHALTPSLPANDLETVRTYTGDVLAELTRILLNVFAADRTQFVQTTVDALALHDVMYRLAEQVSDGVLQCISDDLHTDILRMTDALAKPYDYAGDDWVLGESILDFSRDLKTKIIRIKGEPDTEMQPGESLADPSEREAGAFSNLVVSPNSAVEDSSSGALGDPVICPQVAPVLIPWNLRTISVLYAVPPPHFAALAPLPRLCLSAWIPVGVQMGKRTGCTYAIPAIDAQSVALSQGNAAPDVTYLVVTTTTTMSDTS
ncbi:hypothetical protein VTO73DRAFT_2409 [Trametes versicolor]